MTTLTIESAVYSFEGLLPELESPPIAARRALDHAGLRLSVEAWRSLSADDRERITLSGVPDRVDIEGVASILRRAVPPPQKVAPVSDPDPATPPEALVKALEPHRSIEPRRWARLRAVDRYALAHTYRRAVARSAFSLLGDALDAVLLAAAPTAYDAPGHPRRALPSETPESAAPRSASSPPSNSYQPAGYYSSFIAPPATGEDATPSRMPGVSQARAAYVPGDPAKGEAPARVAYPSQPPSDPPGRVAHALPHETPTTPRNSMLPGHPVSAHINEAGRLHMVDIARKPKTERRAIARGSVRMRPETLSRLTQREAPKGEVLATARLAAILAAKRTHEVIPLCHPVSLTHLDVIFEVDASAPGLLVTAVVDAYDRTGCEMEALTAVSTACLTVYDMLKGNDREMVISDIMLVEKLGGRSGHFRRPEIKP